MTTKYKLRITGECKQNMKLCKRRGLPMDELWTVVAKLLNGEQLEENIMPISSVAIAKDSGNVIFNRIGYLYGKYVTTNLFLFY